MKARIITSSKNMFLGYAEDKNTYQLKIKGKKYFAKKESELEKLKFKKRLDLMEYTPFAVGDLVEFSKVSNFEGLIDKRIERENLLRRWSSKYSKWQTLAANVDFACIVSSVVNPSLKTGFLDRAIVLCELGNCPIIIIINKVDLNANDDEKYAINCYKNLGYKVFELSAESEVGVESFKKTIKDKRIVFIGQSGVGKSSLINLLLKKEIKTKELSKYNKGKHTTTASNFYFYEGGGIIDTPGVKELPINNLESKDIEVAFCEFREFKENCKLKNCSHTHEAKCKVKEALQEKKIETFRYASYIQILEENKNNSIKYF